MIAIVKNPIIRLFLRAKEPVYNDISKIDSKRNLQVNLFFLMNTIKYLSEI